MRRALLLWLLILALPVYGASGTQLRLLGPAHWHGAPVATQGGWLQPAVEAVQRVAAHVQQLRDEAHLRAHAFGHRHEHQGVQRHWHDAADGSVHAVSDPALADLVAGASVGSAALTLAGPITRAAFVARHANGPWPQAPEPGWADAETRPASPPPRG